MEVNLKNMKGLWHIKITKGDKVYEPEPQRDLFMLDFYIENFHLFASGETPTDLPKPNDTISPHNIIRD